MQECGIVNCIEGSVSNDYIEETKDAFARDPTGTNFTSRVACPLFLDNSNPLYSQPCGAVCCDGSQRSSCIDKSPLTLECCPTASDLYSSLQILFYVACGSFGLAFIAIVVCIFCLFLRHYDRVKIKADALPCVFAARRRLDYLRYRYILGLDYQPGDEYVDEKPTGPLCLVVIIFPLFVASSIILFNRWKPKDSTLICLSCGQRTEYEEAAGNIRDAWIWMATSAVVSSFLVLPAALLTIVCCGPERWLGARLSDVFDGAFEAEVDYLFKEALEQFSTQGQFEVEATTSSPQSSEGSFFMGSIQFKPPPMVNHEDPPTCVIKDCYGEVDKEGRISVKLRVTCIHGRAVLKEVCISNPHFLVVKNSDSTGWNGEEVAMEEGKSVMVLLAFGRNGSSRSSYPCLGCGPGKLNPNRCTLIFRFDGFSLEVREGADGKQRLCATHTQKYDLWVDVKGVSHFTLISDGLDTDTTEANNPHSVMTPLRKEMVSRFSSIAKNNFDESFREYTVPDSFFGARHLSIINTGNSALSVQDMFVLPFDASANCQSLGADCEPKATMEPVDWHINSEVSLHHLQTKHHGQLNENNRCGDQARFVRARVAGPKRFHRILCASRSREKNPSFLIQPSCWSGWQISFEPRESAKDLAYYGTRLLKSQQKKCGLHGAMSLVIFWREAHENDPKSTNVVVIHFRGIYPFSAILQEQSLEDSQIIRRLMRAHRDCTSRLRIGDIVKLSFHTQIAIGRKHFDGKSYVPLARKGDLLAAEGEVLVIDEECVTILWINLTNETSGNQKLIDRREEVFTDGESSGDPSLSERHDHHTMKVSELLGGFQKGFNGSMSLQDPTGGHGLKSYIDDDVANNLQLVSTSGLKSPYERMCAVCHEPIGIVEKEYCITLECGHLAHACEKCDVFSNTKCRGFDSVDEPPCTLPHLEKFQISDDLEKFLIKTTPRVKNMLKNFYARLRDRARVNIKLHKWCHFSGRPDVVFEDWIENVGYQKWIPDTPPLKLRFRARFKKNFNFDTPPLLQEARNVAERHCEGGVDLKLRGSRCGGQDLRL